MPNPSDIPTAVALEETDYRRPIVEIDDGATEQVPQQYVGFTVGDEDTNVIAVTAQIYDYQDELARETELLYHMASDAAGTTRIAIDDIALTTGTTLDIFTAESSGRAMTDDSGTIVFSLTEATASQASYLCITYGDSNKVFTQLVTWDAS